MNTIFCLSYAGGAASAYGELKKYASKRNIQLVAIEYAGRASRMDIDLYDNMYEAAKDCYEQIKEYISKHYVQNYGIFGHSMGCWVAYEIIRLLLKEQEIKKPTTLFLSANNIPQIEVEEKLSKLDNDLFWEKMYELGGLEKELYNLVEFKDYILPIIKNDYRILEDYAGRNVEEINIDCDICVMGGRKDTITEEEYRQWNRFTNKAFDMHWFEGDHFYFRNEGKELVDYFCSRIQCEV